MIDRLSVLVKAGVVTAGVSAGVLAGGGVAVAWAEPAAGGATSATSATSSATPPSGTKRRDGATGDSATDTGTDTGVGPDDGSVDDEPGDDSAEAGDGAVVETDDDAAVEDTELDGTEIDGTELDGTELDGTEVNDTQPDIPVVLDPATEGGTGDPVETAPTVVVDEPATSIPEPELSTTQPTSVIEPLATFTASATASQTAATPPRQTLLSILGAVVFNLYSFAIRFVAGPPLLPPGSTVTVRSSELEIDCGDGYEVPADWYVPEGVTPTRLIYLQHGFLAAGPFYSYTAARLAEATHSIVVTTSLTSNFLACDGCWVGGTQMHKAVADLFLPGNTALADSALAAGYASTLLSGVTKVVLMGHSAGGGLAAGTAGYMTQNGTIDRLAGVVMLDGVGFGTVMPAALAKLPDEVPIYNLAGKSYYWNMNGATGAALKQERPGMFTGVRLLNGLHSDTMVGGNLLIQIGLYLVTGFSQPENVKAAEILSAAWVNDMFAGGPTPGSPYYGVDGDTLEIDTPAGTATAFVLPGPTETLTFLDKVFQFFSNIIFGIDFATCAPQASVTSARWTQDRGAEIAELLPSISALSLDGRTKAGQSIGQQCVHG